MQNSKTSSSPRAGPAAASAAARWGYWPLAAARASAWTGAAACSPPGCGGVQDGHAGAIRAGGRACRRPARRNGRRNQGMMGWWWPVAMAATAATARSTSAGVL
jgi:hypothetical protein